MTHKKELQGTTAPGLIVEIVVEDAEVCPFPPATAAR